MSEGGRSKFNFDVCKHSRLFILSVLLIEANLLHVHVRGKKTQLWQIGAFDFCFAAGEASCVSVSEGEEAAIPGRRLPVPTPPLFPQIPGADGFCAANHRASRGPVTTGFPLQELHCSL